MQIRSFLIPFFFIFTLLAILLLSENANAKQNRNYARLYVFHINGINTSRKEAFENRYLLEETAKIGYKLITWDVLYNETHGLLNSDLFDVLRQKNQENTKLDIYDFVDAYMEVHGLNYPFNSPEYRNLLNHLKEYYAKDLEFIGKNFDDIIKQYHEKIAASAQAILTLLKSNEQGKHHMVLLIPHSQGSLYANSLINYLIDAESFPENLLGLYSFASPAAKFTYSGVDNDISYVARNYMIANNDFVINTLRIFSLFSPQSASPLSPNIHLNICNDNRLCHSLTNAYLANKEAVNQFSIDVNRIAGRLISRS